MRKSNAIVSALVPVVIALSLYVVFYSKIECKPDQAGFWLILALGASIGVAITRFSQRSSDKNQGNQK
jgi:hypothetical protein